MNLLQIRTQFAQISGRYDLVNPSTFTDNGADFYIQQGQRSLERRTNINPTRAKYYVDLSIDDYLAKFQNCRAIYSVWVMNSESRTEVVKLEEYDLRAIHQQYVENMYSTPLSTMDSGRPIYYYPTNLRRSPESSTGYSDSETLSSYMDTVSPYNTSYTGIILLPKCDEAYGLEVDGLFYSPALEEDDDQNYWSDNHANLLVWAALRELEIMFRGSKTASAWESFIEAEIMNIDKDGIEQQINSTHEFRG